jgi:hypothetical protein
MKLFFSIVAMIPLALGAAAPVWAEAATPPLDLAPVPAPVQKFGEAHLDCQEWTDGCLVCMRGKACSTPGIACTPKAPLCADKSPIAPPAQKP